MNRLTRYPLFNAPVHWRQGCSFLPPVCLRKAIATDHNEYGDSRMEYRRTEHSRKHRTPYNFAVEIVQPPAPRLAALFHFSKAPGAASVNHLPPTMCTGQQRFGPGAFWRGLFRSGTPVLPSLLPATAIRAGEPLVIQVDAVAKNLNPGGIDQFDVVIITPNGDREQHYAHRIRYKQRSFSRLYQYQRHSAHPSPE